MAKCIQRNKQRSLYTYGSMRSFWINIFKSSISQLKEYEINCCRLERHRVQLFEVNSKKKNTHTQHKYIYKIIIIIKYRMKAKQQTATIYGGNKSALRSNTEQKPRMFYIARIAIIHVFLKYSFLFFSLQNALHGTAGCLNRLRVVFPIN